MYVFFSKNNYLLPILLKGKRDVTVLTTGLRRDCKATNYIISTFAKLLTKF